MTMTGISVLPAALLHAHIASGARRQLPIASSRNTQARACALHVPLVALSLCNLPNLDRRLPSVPCSIASSVDSILCLVSVCAWASARIDWAMKDRSGTGVRASVFFSSDWQSFSSLLRIGSSSWSPCWAPGRTIIRTSFRVTSLLPTFTSPITSIDTGWSRCSSKQPRVRRFAIVFFAVYTYVVRYVDRLLVDPFL